MLKNSLAACFVLVMISTMVPYDAVAQSDDSGMPMRTPDGQPDVSGMFTFRTITPFQRPEQFADQETLDQESAALFETSSTRRKVQVGTSLDQKAVFFPITSSGTSGGSS